MFHLIGPLVQLVEPRAHNSYVNSSSLLRPISLMADPDYNNQAHDVWSYEEGVKDIKRSMCIYGGTEDTQVLGTCAL